METNGARRKYDRQFHLPLTTEQLRRIREVALDRGQFATDMLRPIILQFIDREYEMRGLNRGRREVMRKAR
jgi:hypothetical protein